MILPVKVDDDKCHDFVGNIAGIQRCFMIFCGPLLWSKLLALASWAFRGYYAAMTRRGVNPPAPPLPLGGRGEGLRC